MKQIDEPFNSQLRCKLMLLHFSLSLLLLFCVVFTFTKGGFILYELIHNVDYVPMRITYNVLCISCPAFGLLELLMTLCSFKAMRSLKTRRIKHILNDDGQEIDEDGNAIEKKANLRRLFSLAKPELPLLLTGCFCLLGSSGSQMVAPLFFGKVVDAALKSMAELNKTVLILVVVYMGGSVFSMLRSFTFTLAGQRVVASLRKELFNRVIKQDVAFFDTNRTGELTNRLSSDTQVIQNAVTVNVSMLLRFSIQIIGSLAFMFVLNPALTGILLAVVPVISIATVNYGKYVKRLREKFQNRLADASTVAEECLSSVRTVRTFNCEAKSMNSYGEFINASYKVGKSLSIAQGSFDGAIGFMAYGAICLVLWYGGKLVNEGTVSPGTLTSFLLYTLQIAMAFAMVSSLYGDFMQAVGASVRIFTLLDRIPKVPSEGGIYPQEKLVASVDFRSVRFTYPSRPETEVLKGVTFSVQPGEVVALVGPSGGGKSTIVSLIERFYDPDSGSVSIGGMSVSSLNPKWFRQHMSMVSQEPTLFACSIKENIAYGREATDDEIIEVAKKANAHEFISTFDEGYKTTVGERGVRLSGGQKQRIAIARALIMNPSILLLDEATSALDAESEHLVQEAIDRAMKGRTVLVIAHRLSTVRNANKVIVIEKGSIVEQGTHEELIAKKGVYKKLVLRQLNAGNIPADVDGNINDRKVDIHKNGE
ncbi:ABC transporter B family member 1-like isoform X3 [Tubulanus polymorphus]